MSSSSSSSRLLYTALIRTHHITSRKKLQRVKKSAVQHALPCVLVRSGGAPGIMYAEAAEEGPLAAWVAAVRDLRYKDFQCVRKPVQQRVLLGGGGGGGAVAGRNGNGLPPPPPLSFRELETTAEFGRAMEEKGLGTWWRIGMGYSSSSVSKK